jgi:HK97 family phage prohead protease
MYDTDEEEKTPQGEFEYKAFFDTQMEIKEGGPSGTGTLSGYAAVFGNRDLVGDIVVKGAFERTIPDFVKSGVILARHGMDNAQPVAYLTELKEDDYGLYFSGTYHSTPFAQQERAIAMERLAAKKSVGNSMMYMPYPGVQGAYEYTQDGRVLKSILLGEITTNANLPVNGKATLSGVKAVGGGSLTGLTLADHSDAVLTAVRDYGLRIQGLADLRASQIERGERKSGRVLSASNVAKLEALLAELEKVDTLQDVIREILDAAKPKGNEQPGEGKSVLFDSRRYRAGLSEIESFLAAQGVAILTTK